MSGRYPDSLKVWNVHSDFRERSTPADPIIPIPQWFKQHGYLSFGGGKTYHPNHPKLNDRPHSWSEGTVKGGVFEYFDDPEHGCPTGQGTNPNDPDGNHRGGCGGCPEDKPDMDFYDGRLANWTIRALRLAHEDALYGAKKPFFIATGFRRPHTPWNVAQRFVDMYAKVNTLPKHPGWASGAPQCAWACGGDGVGCDFGIDHPRDPEATKLCRRSYYASVTGTDYYIGRVLSELERLNMAQDTAVALFGDHGWHLGEGGLWAKYMNTELATRVPLIIRAPWLANSQHDQLKQLNRKPAATGIFRSSAFVELVDVYPTLVELAGLPQPKGLEGRSLVTVVEKPYEVPGRAYAQSQFAKCCPKGVGDDFDANRQCGACGKNPSNEISYMGYAVRNNKFRLVTWYRWNKERGLPQCDGLMAVELYSHGTDDGMGTRSFDDFEFANLAANLSLAAALSPAEERIAEVLKLEMRSARALGAELSADGKGWTPQGGGPCTANHGANKPCCGQDEIDLRDTKDVRPCPEDAPFCVDYVYGKHVGRCTAQAPYNGVDHAAGGKGQDRGSHVVATKLMHQDLLRKFKTAFGHCEVAVAVQQHWRSWKRRGEQATSAIQPFFNEIHSELGEWPPDTTCPDPE